MPNSVMASPKDWRDILFSPEMPNSIIASPKDWNLIRSKKLMSWVRWVKGLVTLKVSENQSSLEESLWYRSGKCKSYECRSIIPNPVGHTEIRDPGKIWEDLRHRPGSKQKSGKHHGRSQLLKQEQSISQGKTLAWFWACSWHAHDSRAASLAEHKTQI